MANPPGMSSCYRQLIHTSRRSDTEHASSSLQHWNTSLSNFRKINPLIFATLRAANTLTGSLGVSFFLFFSTLGDGNESATVVVRNAKGHKEIRNETWKICGGWSEEQLYGFSFSLFFDLLMVRNLPPHVISRASRCATSLVGIRGGRSEEFYDFSFVFRYQEMTRIHYRIRLRRHQDAHRVSQESVEDFQSRWRRCFIRFAYPWPEHISDGGNISQPWDSHGRDDQCQKALKYIFRMIN